MAFQHRLVVAAVNCLLLAILGACCLLLHLAAPQTRRGFYCSDTSLSKPFHHSTVSSPVLFAVSFAAPIVAIIAVELATAKKEMFLSIIRLTFYFVFGTGICTLLTFICIPTIGRLRPHFFDVCRPDWSAIECNDGNGIPVYISDYTCRGNEALFGDGDGTAKAVEEARKSFLSGHASISFQSSTFIILYLQARLGARWPDLALVPALQLCAFCFAFFTSLSRIMDNAHHPTDVLAGALLGIAVQTVNVVYFLRLFKSAKDSVKLATKKDDERTAHEAVPMV